MKNQYLFTIIIATYNAETYIEQAIESINSQNYRNYELIVIDGGSSDRTVGILQSYNKYIDYWLTENDEGIYDAWNKGIRKATGEWILFLGSDDRLKPDALQLYCTFINSLKKEVDYISSRNEIIDQSGNFVRVKGWPWEWPLFLNEMTVAHPGSLHSQRLFKKYGNFNTSYKIVGDFEFLLRPRGQLSAAFFDEVTVTMREGGASDSIAAVREAVKASIHTGGSTVTNAGLNFIFVFSKFTVKKMFRKIKFNVYLKH